MDIFLRYLGVFGIGGLICLLAQIFIIRTKVTSSRILVTLVIIGAILEGLGLFQYIVAVGHSGATVPILGFGSLLTKGAIKGARGEGFIGLLKGPLTSASVGICVSVLSAYLFTIIFSSHTKNKK